MRKPQLGKYELLRFCEACRAMEFFYYDFINATWRCINCNLNPEGKL